MKILSSGNLLNDFTSKILSFIEIIIISATYTFVFFGVSGYALSLLIDNFNITLWSMLLILIFILVTSYILINKRSFPIHQNKNASIKNSLLMFLPYIIFIPGVIASFILVDMQMRPHGGYHIAYVYQILKSFIPPENVVLPGYGANIYWLYHALLATFVNISNLSAPQVSSILNLFTLISSFYWINRILKALNIKQKKPFIISCYAIFILLGLNLFAPLHILINLDFYKILFIDIDKEYLFYINPTIVGDKRITNLYVKYLVFNGAPIGIMYFLTSLYYALMIVREKLTLNYILFLMISVAGALIFHATTGLFILGTIPLALIATIFYFREKDLKDVFQAIKPFEWIILFIVSIVLFVPILHYIYLAASTLPSNTANEYRPLMSILFNIYPLAILLLIALYLRSIKITNINLFLVLVSVIGYILTILVDLPGNNQYKFIFLSTISFCTLIVILLDKSYYYSVGKIKLALKALFLIIAILISISVLVASTIKIYNPMGAKIFKNYYYKDTQIHLRNGAPFKNAYDWIRENTQENTIVILPLESKNHSKIYTIAERLTYVTCASLFGDGIEEYHKRIENAMQFYGETMPPDDHPCYKLPEVEFLEKTSTKRSEILNEFKNFSSERSTVLLIPKDKLDDVVLEDKILEVVYSDEDANIYRFKN